MRNEPFSARRTEDKFPYDILVVTQIFVQQVIQLLWVWLSKRLSKTILVGELTVSFRVSFRSVILFGKSANVLCVLKVRWTNIGQEQGKQIQALCLIPTTSLDGGFSF